MPKRKNAELRKTEILEHFYKVIIEQGIEGASIIKIAKSMNIHPSLISHYFKTKGAMLIEFADFIKVKYDPPFIRNQFVTITDPQQRYDAFFDTMFSEANIKSINDSVYYAIYYLSYRNPEIKSRFSDMFKKHRDFIMQELRFFKKVGLVKKEIDLTLAANFIVSVFEGLSFQNVFFSNGDGFKVFEKFAVKIIKDFLES
jgi:AcrR family transcriptional regulator